VRIAIASYFASIKFNETNYFHSLRVEGNFPEHKTKGNQRKGAGRTRLRPETARVEREKEIEHWNDGHNN
jgi:hypothetical protein